LLNLLIDSFSPETLTA